MCMVYLFVYLFFLLMMLESNLSDLFLDVFLLYNRDYLIQKLNLPNNSLIVPLIGTLSGNDYANNIPRFGIAGVTEYLKNEMNPLSTNRDVIIKNFVVKNLSHEDIKSFTHNFTLASNVFLDYSEDVISTITTTTTKPFTCSYLNNPWFQCISSPDNDILKYYKNKILLPSGDSSGNNSIVITKRCNKWEVPFKNQVPYHFDPRRLIACSPVATDRKFIGWTKEQYQMEVDETKK